MQDSLFKFLMPVEKSFQTNSITKKMKNQQSQLKLNKNQLNKNNRNKASRNKRSKKKRKRRKSKSNKKPNNNPLSR